MAAVLFFVEGASGCSFLAALHTLGVEEGTQDFSLGLGEQEGVTRVRLFIKGVDSQFGNAAFQGSTNRTDPSGSLVQNFIVRRIGKCFFQLSAVVNGPKFSENTLRDWLERVKVQTLFTEPGSPREKGCIESFNGKFRDELHHGELFDTFLEAKVLSERAGLARWLPQHDINTGTYSWAGQPLQEIFQSILLPIWYT